MRALLILKEKKGNLRVVVRLKQRTIKNQVALLLGMNKNQEAFDLLKTWGEVEVYLPTGTRLPFIPPVTLIEDLL